MIKRFRVQNYKALRDVTLDLTPIHVFIGPNDSGKTSILEAIRALCRTATRSLSSAFSGNWEGLELVWRRSPPNKVLTFEVTVLDPDSDVECTYKLSCKFDTAGRGVKVRSESIEDTQGKGSGFETAGREATFLHVFDKEKRGNAVKLPRLVYDSIDGVHLYRWNPSHLALPVAAEASYTFPLGMSGFGLSRCLDDILGQSRENFMALESRFKAIFPDVESILLIPTQGYQPFSNDAAPFPSPAQGPGRGLEFAFRNGTRIGASQVSDGALLVLAYLCILHLPTPPRVVLVEEPENGVHPARLKEVLAILRELVKEQSRTQVIMTTHSPYVVDLFQPEEVTLCIKEDDGSISTRRLSESQKVREQIDVFTLGEIWTGEGDEAIAKSAAPENEEEPRQ